MFRHPSPLSRPWCSPRRWWSHQWGLFGDLGTNNFTLVSPLPEMWVSCAPCFKAMHKKAQTFILMKFVISVKHQKVSVLRKCHPSPHLNDVLSLWIGTKPREGHSESGRIREGSTRSVHPSKKFFIIQKRKKEVSLGGLGTFCSSQMLLSSSWHSVIFRSASPGTSGHPTTLPGSLLQPREPKTGPDPSSP